nr:transglutaminase family protein [Polyangium fumosum]
MPGSRARHRRSKAARGLLQSPPWQAGPLTCTASEVLRHRTGFCYAKSHLLAALLRANGLPAGFCYQRLAHGSGYCLHGFNAVELPGIGWYRIDARGNKPGIDAAFDPPSVSTRSTEGRCPEQHGCVRA